ncbi:MAG: sugar phosphate isomerase [Tenericutes bacterium GWC2_34_14]|nr:MAG: sugar phosphate isomerase [Tenericutes bacterium GWA2_35_7]OHE28833.1 MAG: sugar phosphate isomerase [Tenericutes bacterium GWC2_34_14]OHE33301.1 MAG: sugar phosphate isomerase [Tenericutes bacterium GWE2_34_108]OHE36451.1 MAG: sugar phosphate isomerase [Tenericutes bacterium GWF1_35_14]OHE37655.1 MAG: sugar phosphate isomerase [Tenericutes bacterium GWF2_35_184]OHE45068.1 MAG: sugar phosphate isomerase [Tenericutes bacterium RIFOXYA2_FULL_36_32]OHE45834.1 MAG: sugar phosphate isomera
MKNIFVGSDKSGYTLKEAVKAYLVEQGFTVEDIGTVDENNPFPFFEVAQKGAKLIQQKAFERGILICGTGMGMSVVANKHEGVYAAACESVYAAEKCRAINDANILCMGGWIIAPIMGVEMTKAFINTSFTQNLEDWRARNLEKARVAVREIEQASFHKSRS